MDGGEPPSEDSNVQGPDVDMPKDFAMLARQVGMCLGGHIG